MWNRERPRGGERRPAGSCPRRHGGSSRIIPGRTLRRCGPGGSKSCARDHAPEPADGRQRSHEPSCPERTCSSRPAVDGSLPRPIFARPQAGAARLPAAVTTRRTFCIGISAPGFCALVTKMLRTPAMLSSNRSLVVLLAIVLVTLAGIAAAREFPSALLQPASPTYAPAENPAPIAPAVEASSPAMPTSETAPSVQTGASPFPAPQTAAPAPATPYRAAPTTAPHPTVPVGPATTAAPSSDVPVIAPELGMPTFPPPPGHE